MPRLGLIRNVTFFALAMSVTATFLEARKLECSYDYVTHKTVETITETDNVTENLEYTYHHEFGSGGQDMWLFSDKASPTLETNGQEPYLKLWGNLYKKSDTYFPSIVYIDFETVKYHQIQVIDAYLKDVEKLPHGYVDSNRMLEIPVIIWDCRRLD